MVGLLLEFIHYYYCSDFPSWLSSRVMREGSCSEILSGKRDDYYPAARWAASVGGQVNLSSQNTTIDGHDYTRYIGCLVRA